MRFSTLTAAPRPLIGSVAALAMTAFIICAAFRADARSAAPQPDAFFAPTADLSAALRQARDSGKSGVVILYEMEGCGECRKLHATTLQNERLRALYRGAFVTVAIRADEPAPLTGFDGEATTQLEFAAQQGIVALPTVVFHDIDALPVIRQSGSALPLPEWLLLGEYVRTAGYDALPFPLWREARQKSAERPPPA